MKPHFPRPVLWISLTCMSTGLAACLSPFATQSANPAPIAAPSQIAQVGFVRDVEIFQRGTKDKWEQPG